MIRTIDPTHTLNPFRLPDTQPANRPHSIADLDRSLPRQAPPVLQLPGPTHSFSDSTDTEQPRLTTTPSGTAHYEVRVRADGTTIVGADTHQIQVRFLTDRETKHIRLPKSSTWVPWAKMSVIEFKHHQSHEPGLQNIWCPAPYCWLLCSQFLQACKQKSLCQEVVCANFLRSRSAEVSRGQPINTKATTRQISAGQKNRRATA